MIPAAHKDWLTGYVATKIAASPGDPEPLRLKLRHTMEVAANAEEIIRNENIAPELRRASGLAALYHDLSRFDQYLQYGTFKDTDSRNHGAWSVKLLKSCRRLEDETPQARKIILVAVGMHNRMAVPSAVSGATRLVCNLVRDADKLDIVRVMAAHLAQKPYNPTVVLGLPDDPDLVSEETIAAALSGRPASYADLRSVNDFRLLLGTWVYAMNFKSSRSIFTHSPQLQEILADLPAHGPYRKARESILKLLVH